MGDPQPCDFCGAPVMWTEEQKALDQALVLHGKGFCTGLGVMCDACGDREIANVLAEMEREDALIAEEERGDG
ncbi:MAG: hypothetical protein EON59_03825 [Alphaproteobacteria bacterium]|nr:MAG: hypothetical protein EON59_03825 [Alphaproteobacteria bacterium]